MLITQITEGRIKVNEPLHLIDHPNVHVFEFDLDSKYPGGVAWLLEGDRVRFIIEAGDRTLNTRPEASAETEVLLEGLSTDEWHIMSEAVRYTWRVVLYRHHPQ